ncbi:MAG: nucleoside deaminase [Alphaproteobacteria bacterium]|nr:nucleoside deaminase [Alphaproteobacteria bacterium]
MNPLIVEAALQQARRAYRADEVPVGAVVFDSRTGAIVARASNRVEAAQNPTAHAEMRAIQKACQKLRTKFLTGYSLFVTLEPCAMCAGAIAWARLDALHYGAFDPKTGAVRQGAKVFSRRQTHHKPRVRGGIAAAECGGLMTSFFKDKR